MEWIVTDQGSHFTSTLMKDMTEDMKLDHHFTTAHCPWANGSVERICREVIRANRAVLSEMKLDPTEWTAIVECVQSILNR